MNCNERIVIVRHYDSPCGGILLAATENGLCLCDWAVNPRVERNKQRLQRLLNAKLVTGTSSLLERTITQLDEYFSGRRRFFDIPLCPVGSEFQKRVWEALPRIPYGETKTYKDIALLIGAPQSVRAVAGAIGANALSLFIPCHRVVGSNCSLTGFSGGLEAKAALLEMEKKVKRGLLIDVGIKVLSIKR